MRLLRRHGSRRTILSGVLTVGLVLAVVYFWGVQGGISEANVLQVVLAKAVVLAVGLYFTFGAGRIYRANAHLAVVNRHREDSLKTFRAFVAGAGDDQETKSKLLLEAAHAAFGQVPTGLAPTKEGGNTLEVLDGATRVIRARVIPITWLVPPVPPPHPYENIRGAVCISPPVHGSASDGSTGGRPSK